MFTKRMMLMVAVTLTLASASRAQDPADPVVQFLNKAIADRQVELDKVVEQNDKSSAWNEKHGGTVAQLHEMVKYFAAPFPLLSEGSDAKAVGAARTEREDNMKKAIAALKELEKQGEIASLADVLELAQDLNNRKYVAKDGTKQFEVSASLRDRHLIPLIHQIEQMIDRDKLTGAVDPAKVLKDEAKNLPRRSGPFEFNFPTISFEDGRVTSTPERPILDTTHEQAMVKGCTGLKGEYCNCPAVPALMTSIDHMASTKRSQQERLTEIRKNRKTRQETLIREALDAAMKIEIIPTDGSDKVEINGEDHSALDLALDIREKIVAETLLSEVKPTKEFTALQTGLHNSTGKDIVYREDAPDFARIEKALSSLTSLQASVMSLDKKANVVVTALKRDKVKNLLSVFETIKKDETIVRLASEEADANGIIAQSDKDAQILEACKASYPVAVQNILNGTYTKSEESLKEGQEKFHQISSDSNVETFKRFPLVK